LRDPVYFARVVIDPVAGTVVWPNEADLAPEALYELEAEEEPASEPAFSGEISVSAYPQRVPA